MKILISSKTLYGELSKIDLDKHPVLYATANQHQLQLGLPGEEVVFSCNLILHHSSTFSQEDARWDWVKKLMGQVDEQPVALSISHNKVEVTFQY